MKKFSLASALAILAIGFGFETEVAAQPKGWVVDCKTDRMTDVRSCLIAKAVWSEAARQYLMLAITDDRVGIVAKGTGSGARARIRVDGGTLFETSDCSRGMCSFDREKSIEIIKLIEDGRRALIEFAFQTGQVVGPEEIPINGYAEALAKPGSTSSK
ncbi:hypothetical protein [Nitrobacter sp.]|uniref:hypothetical protein n=1 Tax=Nitrobacter sp. TaxID=29420 RepID=UPI0029CAB145|nr:hypothetical protein [Nitrobacter sp.]